MASVFVMYSAMASSCGIGSKGLAAVVLIEACHDHALSHIRQFVADGHEIQIEELTFINADHLRLGVQARRISLRCVTSCDLIFMSL